MNGYMPGYVLLMNFFTSLGSNTCTCSSFCPPLLGFLLAGYVASQGCMEGITSKQRDRSPATPVAPKLPLLSISVPPTVVACSGRGGL